MRERVARPRVVLHGARAERVEVRVDREVLLRQAACSDAPRRARRPPAAAAACARRSSRRECARLPRSAAAPVRGLCRPGRDSSKISMCIGASGRRQPTRKSGASRRAHSTSAQPAPRRSSAPARSPAPAPSAAPCCSRRAPPRARAVRPFERSAGDVHAIAPVEVAAAQRGQRHDVAEALGRRRSGPARTAGRPI